MSIVYQIGYPVYPGDYENRVSTTTRVNNDVNTPCNKLCDYIRRDPYCKYIVVLTFLIGVTSFCLGYVVFRIVLERVT